MYSNLIQPKSFTLLFLVLFLFSAFKKAGGEEYPPGLINEYEEVLTLVNALRAQGCNCGNKRMPPVGPLVWNKLLYQSALGHAQYMNRAKILSHTGQNRSSLSARIDAVGYDWMTVGENVAVGYLTPKEVVKGWKNSLSHCKGIMNGDFKETGIARSGDYWCQDFGGR